VRAHHIYLNPQQLLKFDQKPCVVEQASVGFELHEQVDIALFVCFATRDGAEDAHIPRAVLYANLQNFVPLGSQKRLKGHLRAIGYPLCGLSSILPCKVSVRLV
jgi:hypothetical protein